MTRRVLFVCALLLIAPAQAAVDPAIADKITASLRALLPDLQTDEIRATPIENLYEVSIGMRVVYVTGDGRFLVQGNVIDLETRTEITAERQSALKLAALNEVGEDQMVIFGPDDAEYTVTVFTDIDCGYCRRLHGDMAGYNDKGIRIRYLFYPRAGVGSESYNKAVSVWCADDRKEAMTQAKAGQAVAPKTCDNPVDEHYALGQAMRLQGTPALVLESGETVPGYVPPDKLRQALDQRRNAAVN
jgi:thiol:disulfide interchange protein DsbC